MLKKFYYIVVAIVTLGIFLSSSVSAQQIDINKIKEQLPKLLGANNIGTEFVFGFHPCWEEVGPNNAIRIYVTSPVETEVRLTIPYFSSDPYMVKKTKPNDVIEFILAPNVAQPYVRGAGGAVGTLLPTQVWPGRGIIVTSDAPIVCYGVTRFQYTSDGFLALPVHALGKNYTISSYRETANFQSQSLTPYADIIGVYDKTKVLFYFGGNNSSKIRTVDEKKWSPHDILRADLNRGDFWLLASEGPQSDIGGSYVVSNKPVACLSGSHCAYVPTTNSACDFISEQELPTFAWGKKLHVTPLIDRKYASIIRAFCKEAPTTFLRDGQEVFQLFSSWGMENEGWVELRANPDGNFPAVYSSDKAINIVQYCPGQSEDGVPADPFQLMLAPEEQFQNEILFNTPGIKGGYGFLRNYINIVYKSDSTGMIPDDLDFGEVVTTGETKWTKVKDLSSSPGQQFKDPDYFGKKDQMFAKTIKLAYDGVYRLRCPSQKIAAYAYGFGVYDSYGFPTSMALADLEKPDTNAPVPVYELLCDGNTIDKKTMVLDMPDNDTVRSNLALILFDKNNSFNYDFTYDDFVPGESRGTKWKLRTIDPSQDARAVITFTDRAGNDTTIIVEYWAVKLSIAPKNVYYGNMKIGEQKTQNFVIKNESKTSPAYLKEVSLRTLRESLATQGFKLDYTFDISQPLMPQQTLPFTVTFTAPYEGEFRDSIGVGDTCFYKYKALVRASVGTPIIEVSDVHFGKNTVGIQTNPRISTITNNGTTSLAITGYKTNTLSVFTHNLPAITPSNPLIIDKGGQYQFEIYFQPDAVKTYQDSIVFISDAGYNIDPVALIDGEGIEPQLEATGDDWGRRRAHLVKYDTYPFYKFTPYPAPTGAIVLKNEGSKEVSISQINILEDVRGEAFEIMVNGNLAPLKNFVNNLGQIRDDQGNAINVIPAGATRHIPVFFHPKAEGEYKLNIEYASDAPTKPNSLLTGIGIYPKISTVDADFGTKVIGEAPSKRTIRFTNETWDYQDSVTIQSLTIAPNGSISAVIGTPGTEGFSYDAPNIRVGMTGVCKFPQVLQPGDYLEIDGEFAAVKTGNALATMTSVSDADLDVTSNWTAFGIAEKLELLGGIEPFLCYNTNEEITCKLVNSGSSKITIPANSIVLLNNTNNSFVIDRVLRADNTPIDLSQDFTIDKTETINIIIKFLPVVKLQNNVEEIHTATLQVKSLSVTPEYQTLTVGVKARAIHYTRTSESMINGETTVTVDPGQNIKEKPIIYSIYIKSGQELDLANPTEYTVVVKYEKNFIGIDQNADKSLKISAGRDLPAGWTVTDYDLVLDKPTNVETVTIHLKGATPVKSKDRTELVKIEFMAFLPWYKTEDGQVVIKSKSIDIKHTIATNEQCVDYIDPAPMVAKLTETCVDNLRPIMISAADYNLGQINPNPVGANGTDISFSIAFAGYTEIRIVSSNGEVVDTPISKNMKAGNFTLRLPIEKLTSGTYILEMKSGEFNEIRKFNVVK